MKTTFSHHIGLLLAMVGFIGIGIYSAPAAAPVTAAGAPPNLVEPGNGVHLSELGAMFRWQQPPDTKWYQFQLIPINNDGIGVDVIVGDTVQVNTATFEVKSPDFFSSDPNYVILPDMTYTWRVRTAASGTVPTPNDWSDWSSRVFRTPIRTGATIGIGNTPDGAEVLTTTPTLAWTNSDRSVFYYEIQMGLNPNFPTTPGSPFLYWELRHGGATTPPNSYTVTTPELIRGQTYFWRVRPRVQGDGNPTFWSNTFTFKTPPR